MKKLRRRCQGYCGQVFDVYNGNDFPSKPYNARKRTGEIVVRWRSDPFQEEIHGDLTPMWLCDECEYQSDMDI